MAKIVVDSYAWINYFNGDSEEVKKLIEGNELHTSAFSVAEIASRSERGGANAGPVVSAIYYLSRIWSADQDNILKVAKLHAKMREMHKDFGLGDCFVLELAERLGAKILTGDRHFKGIKNVIFIG